MKTTFVSFPMVECPRCGKEFQWDDYYDVEDDDERECPLCNGMIRVTNVDTSITATLVSLPNKHL